MKKMFVTGMNMNEPKAYIEPEMKVIEVDVECLQTPNSGYGADGSDIDDVDDSQDPFGIKNNRSIFDNIW